MFYKYKKMKGKIWKIIAGLLLISICAYVIGDLVFLGIKTNRWENWTVREKAIIYFSKAPMRVLTINHRGDSLRLRRNSLGLSDKMLESKQYEKLCKLLLATVQDPSQDGVGIAGPQVGISRRIVAVQRFDKPGEPFEVYPNIRISGVNLGKDPALLPGGVPDLNAAMEPGPEGCLSVPGLRGDVMRWRDIDITYTLVGASADGKPDASLAIRDTTERVQGFTAVIFQHECDHLDGVLYIDKVIPGTLRESD